MKQNTIEQAIEPAPRLSGRQRRMKELPEHKSEARRIQLAEATLETLGELGYARTSLREIAQKSEYTHGVLHYYFADKLDLISCAIRQFKAKCVTRYDEITATARDRDELMAGFLDKLAATMRDEPRLHCLWYDMRAQALFETSFRNDVSTIDKSLEGMIWRVVRRYAELGGSQPRVTPGVAYALLDGLFQKHLLRHISDDPAAIDDMIDEVKQLLPLLA